MNRRELIQLMIAAVMAPTNLVLAGPYVRPHVLLWIKGMIAYGYARQPRRAEVRLSRNSGEVLFDLYLNACGGTVKWYPTPGNIVFMNSVPVLASTHPEVIAGVWGHYDDGTSWGMSIGCDEDYSIRDYTIRRLV